MQWIYGLDEDNAYYSHDHGWYLTGQEWTINTLDRGRDVAVPLSIPAEQLDPEELLRLAGTLEGVTREEIEGELSKIPASWPVSDEELEAVAEFAYSRRVAVAGRLRSLLA